MSQDNRREVKKMVKKNKKRFFTYKSLKEEVNRYGYSYSFKDFFIKLLMVLIGFVAAGIFYELNGVCVAIVVLLAFLVTPMIIASQFMDMYERKRFDDVTQYMEQMIYSFKKMPKIQSALEDTLTLMDGRMAELIEDALDCLHNDISEDEDVFTKALGIIEKEYYCDKLKALHRFLIKIENRGGRYDNSINILLEDIQGWTARTYTFQKEKKSIKGKILLTIILSIVISGATLFMMPEYISISGSPLYQIVTTCFLCGLILLYTFINRKINGSWIGASEIRTNDDVIRKDYALATEYDIDASRRRSIPIVVIALIIIGTCILIKQYIFAGLGVFLLITAVRKPKTVPKNAKKRITREIEKEFPNWLRDMSVNLQTETVQVAITNSIDEASEALKPALYQLIEDFETDPTGINPYLHFLKEFDLPEIKSTMKMFYALNNAGREDAEQQINVLIDRNNKLLDKAETIRNEDSISGMGFFTALPMVLSTGKLAVDMVLMLLAFMSIM